MHKTKALLGDAGASFENAFVHSPICAVSRSELQVRGSRSTCNTKGYSSTNLAMGFANIRAGTWYPPEH